LDELADVIPLGYAFPAADLFVKLPYGAAGRVDLDMSADPVSAVSGSPQEVG
jgi:hypothetical protein